MLEQRSAVFTADGGKHWKYTNVLLKPLVASTRSRVVLLLTLRRRNVFLLQRIVKEVVSAVLGGLKDRQQTEVKSKRHFLMYPGEKVSVARGCNQGFLSLM